MSRQEPHTNPIETPAAAAWERAGLPTHTKPAKFGVGMGDENMTGQHRADKVILHNSHPHQEHSIGYHDAAAGAKYENHGFESVHINHGRRDKGPEHHPPLGLYEPDALDSLKGKQTVF